jgi:hypothetical protein
LASLAASLVSSYPAKRLYTDCGNKGRDLEWDKPTIIKLLPRLNPSKFQRILEEQEAILKA